MLNLRAKCLKLGVCPKLNAYNLQQLPFFMGTNDNEI